MRRLACRGLLLMLAMFALDACSVSKPYVLPANTELARLNLRAGVDYWICAVGVGEESLMRDAEGYTAIPAGRIVSIIAAHQAQTDINAGPCYATVSFVPKAGSSYYQDMDWQGEKCTSLIYREVSAKEGGLELEASARSGGDCGRN